MKRSSSTASAEPRRSSTTSGNRERTAADSSTAVAANDQAGTPATRGYRIAGGGVGRRVRAGLDEQLQAVQRRRQHGDVRRPHRDGDAGGARRGGRGRRGPRLRLEPPCRREPQEERKTGAAATHLEPDRTTAYNALFVVMDIPKRSPRVRCA